MADPIGELFVKILPDTAGFGPAVAAQTGAATSGAMSAVSKGSTVALAGVLAVGGGLVAMGSAADDAYDKIRVGTGATGDALAGLEDSFKAVLSDVPTDADAASTAIANINTALGLTGENLETRSAQFLELSRITGEDLEGAIASVTGVFNQFGVDVGEQEGVLDNFFRAAQASGLTVTQIADQYGRAGPALESLGFSMVETTGIIGLLGKSGVDATQILPGFTRVIKDAAEEGVSAQDALAGVFNEIANAPDTASATAIALEAFGNRAGPLLASQIREGGLSLDDLWGSLGAGEDTILGVGEETKDFAEQLTELKNKVFVALEPAASKLFASIGESVESLAPTIVILVEALVPLIELFASIPAPVQAAIIGALAFGAVANKLVGPIMAVIKVFKLLSVTLAANPWVLVAIAVVALAVVIYKNWDKILAFLKKTWEIIKQVAGVVWDAIKTAIVAVVEAISTAISATWNAIKTATQATWDFIKMITETVWNAIKTAFEAVLLAIQTVVQFYFDVYKTIITTAWDVIKAVTEAVWNTIMAVLTTVWNVIQGVVTTAVGIVRSIVEGAWNALKATTDTIWNGIKAVIDIATQGITNLIYNVTHPVEFLIGLWDTLKSGAETAWNGIVNAVQNAWNRLKGLFEEIRSAADRALGPVDEIIGKGGSIIGGAISRIPGLAHGGTARANKPHWVGEDGTELFVPNRTGTIIPNDMLAGALAGGGGGGQAFNFNFTGPISVRNDQDIVKLSRALAEDARRTFRAEGKQVTG